MQMGYSEEMFDLEVRFARATADGDTGSAEELGKDLAMRGIVDCGVCGGMIRFHFLDNWVHQDEGLDHDARPNRIGFQWPEGLKEPGGRAAH
jgi:hypothetical protein